MKSDIEIARSVKLKNIREIAAQVGFPEEEVFNYGKHIAKIPYKVFIDMLRHPLTTSGIEKFLSDWDGMKA